MVLYDLSHLTQDASEYAYGPIQDTEALMLFSIVRGMRMQRILEIGGLSGYSARNFLKAFATPATSIMYTVDINPVSVLAENHRVILKDARFLSPEDFDHKPLDLVFFDCHDFAAQMEMYSRLVGHGIVTDATVIALHDTNLHPTQIFNGGYKVEGGWVHQHVERQMVNVLVEKHGYHAFNLHTKPDRHDVSMPFRHGITILQKFRTLIT